MTERVTQGDAITAIANAGATPDELGLISDLFEANHRSLESTFQMLYEGEKAAHERTQERLAAALAQIRTVRHRASWLAGDTDELYPIWLDEA